MKKAKLELTWIGKEARPRLEPRILLEDPAQSYHATQRVTENDSFDNRLIFGDNLLALKALEQEFAGKIKCIYIDPPYNTGSAYEHYEDGLEHSLWLTMMRDRLEMLRRLLCEDGSIWISIDDNEAHYLKVLCDEVFGRANFITSVIWQKIYTVKNTAKHFSEMHDYILVYTKNADCWKINLLPRTEKQDSAYTNPDNDPRGPWKATPIQARNYYSQGLYAITAPSGRVISGPPKGTYWRVPEHKFKEMDADNRIWWGQEGNSIPAQKRFLTDVKEGVVPATLWLHTEAGQNAEAKTEGRELFADIDDIFLTPKPERLIQRILTLATNPDDIVLDSFAGSGTTGAVAHKMGRRWIMVELGKQCHTLIIPRLKKVIDGTDQGGISQAIRWKGGGGFRYYRLAPSLLEKDRWGNWVVNKQYNAAMVASAMCKHEGFTYAPSDIVYWQQGHSTERDFIYVTTQTLNRDQLAALAEEVGDNRTLLVCCGAFRANPADFPNLTLKKIPNAVLNRCEWGRDDYSLQIASLPAAEPAPNGDGEAEPLPRAKRAKLAEAPLFEQGGEA
jgi:adenine-specific DNA-methyltransferase